MIFYQKTNLGTIQQTSTVISIEIKKISVPQYTIELSIKNPNEIYSLKLKLNLSDKTLLFYPKTFIFRSKALYQIPTSKGVDL